MSLHPLFARSAAPLFGDPKSRKVAERWFALAERRLAYLTELFDSGRWRRFHDEAEFLENIAEAKDAVARWQAMANGEFVAPVIRAAPPLQPILAAIEDTVAGLRSRSSSIKPRCCPSRTAWPNATLRAGRIAS